MTLTNRPFLTVALAATLAVASWPGAAQAQVTNAQRAQALEAAGVLRQVSTQMQKVYSGKQLPGVTDQAIETAGFLDALREQYVIPKYWDRTEDGSALVLKSGQVLRLSLNPDGKGWSATLANAPAHLCAVPLGLIASTPGLYDSAVVGTTPVSFPIEQGSPSDICGDGGQDVTYTLAHDPSAIPLSPASTKVLEAAKGLHTAITRIYANRPSYGRGNMDVEIAVSGQIDETMVKRRGRVVRIIAAPGTEAHMQAIGDGNTYRMDLSTISASECGALTKAFFAADLDGLTGFGYGRYNAARSNSPALTSPDQTDKLAEYCEKAGRRPTLTLYFTRNAAE